MIHAPHGAGRSTVGIFSAGITTYPQLKHFLDSHNDRNITGAWWHFAIWTQEEARRTSKLSTWMIEAGATRTDVSSDTFVAAVAYRFLFAKPSAAARTGQFEYATAVRKACSAARGHNGWSDPWRRSEVAESTLSSPVQPIDIVVHMRTWAEDTQCAVKSRERFSSTAPFECGRCISKGAIECAWGHVSRVVASRDKSAPPLCALVLSDFPHAANSMAQRLAAIPGLDAVSEYAVAFEPRSGRRRNGGGGGSSDSSAAWHSQDISATSHALASKSVIAWLLLSTASSRLYTGGSTYSYAAVLRTPAWQADAVLDLRCIRAGVAQDAAAAAASSKEWAFELRGNEISRHPSAATWRKGRCAADTGTCEWKSMPGFNAPNLVRNMGDVDRCAHLRFKTLEAAQRACARLDECGSITRDGGLACDLLLNNGEPPADAPPRCLVGTWPLTSSGALPTRKTLRAERTAMRADKMSARARAVRSPKMP